MAHFEETAVGYKTIFQKTFNDTKSEARAIATEVKSNSLSEKYTWLGNFPTVKEWVGERDVKKFEDYGYALENKLFEATVTVPNTHIEYDKIGLYNPAIQQMAINAKQFPSQLVAALLLVGEDAIKGKCYDGAAFFGEHTIGSDTYTNLSTGKELNSENALAVESFMRSIKNDGGQSLNIAPTLIVCGPSNLANVIATVGKENLAGGEANPTYKRYEYLVLNEITDKSWYMFDNSKPLKALIIQIAKDGVFEASNDDKFMKDHALFGTKSFMNAGFALWQLAFKCKGA